MLAVISELNLEEKTVLANKHCSIVLVEDDVPVRKRFVTLINGWSGGKLIADVGSLNDTIKLIHEQPIDLLITDLRLPDGNGIEAIKLIREIQPKAEVMVISVLGDHNTVIRAIEAGATGFLLKDASSFNLIEAVEELMAGGSPVSPAIARTIIRKISPSEEQIAHSNQETQNTLGHNLTTREREILYGVVKGHTNGELAEIYGISASTVPVHIRNIYRKLETRNRSETIYEAMRLGLVEG